MRQRLPGADRAEHRGGGASRRPREAAGRGARHPVDPPAGGISPPHEAGHPRGAEGPQSTREGFDGGNGHPIELQPARQQGLYMEIKVLPVLPDR